MLPIYISLVNNVLNFKDLQALGDNAVDLKFSLVHRVTRQAVDIDMTVTGNDRRHEGVEVSTVTMARNSDSALGSLSDWWNKTEIYKIVLEWYHIDSAAVVVSTHGNEKHIANYALKIEKA